MAGFDHYSQFELFYDKENYYFKPFPYIDYDINGDGTTNRIKNFLKRFDFLQLVKDKGSIYIEWIVRDEDTPEVIAHKLYGSTNMYWIVLMINDIHDPVFEWALTADKLFDYMAKKYGSENLQGTHHYESVDTGDEYDLPDGIIVDENYSSKVAITNEDYEIKLNDAKRKIRILKPEYIHYVKQEWEVMGRSDFERVR